MKTTMRYLLVAGLLPVLLPGAGFGSIPSTVNSHMRIVVTEEPIFPAKYIDSPISWGEVRLAIGVDQNGKLFDYLVTAYTQEEFRDSVLRVLPKWKFVPMEFNGFPTATVSEVVIRFEHGGVRVVNLTIGTAIEQRVLDIQGGNTFEYKVSRLSQLDSVPVTKHIVRPVYPRQLADQGIQGNVKVDFYIDSTGRVRLPCVVQTATPQLAKAAVDAVEQWTFDPPRRKGRAVVVRASQLFEFRGSKTSS